MLGRVFNSGRNSARDTAQYKKLPQEEEEEDNVLFKRDGEEITQKQNGVHPEGSEEVANGTTPKTGDVSPDSEIPELVQVRVYKAPRLTRTRLACYSLSVIFCLLLASLFAFVIPYSKMFHRIVIGKTYDTTPPWNSTFLDSVTDSPVRLVDIDKDGRLDIIVAMSSSHVTKEGESFKECPLKDGHYPCSSQLYAIRGYDGKELWKVPLEGAVVAINCGQLESDEHTDCVISGHRGLLVRVNSKTGEIIWSAKRNQIGDRVIVHHSLVLPDVNGDKVPDIVVSVTGDPAFRNLGGGKLILISSDTGFVLGEPFALPLSSSATSPNTAANIAPATNIPPVLHTLKDGSQYVLFGSGGLNQPGGLHAIALPMFVRKVMGWNTTHAVPNTRGEYKAWDHATIDEKTGVVQIWGSTTRGIAVPPLCADVNLDGTSDILVTTGSGTVVLYQGETLAKLWEYKDEDPAAEYESLSQPAPGYFNSDKKLDFMLHLNHGTWPKYSGSKAVVIDGKDGKAMWTYNSSSPEFTSDLVISMKKERDAFLTHLHVDQSKVRRKRYSREWPPKKYPKYPQRPEDTWPYPKYNSDVAFGTNRDQDGEDLPYYSPGQYQQEYYPDYLQQESPRRQKYDEYGTEGGRVMKPEFIPRTGRKHVPLYKPNSRRRPIVQQPELANFEEPPFHPCAMSQMLDRGDVFLMDRTNLKNPIRIAKHDESITATNSDCTFYHHGTSVGAVGDIDGDIHHEVILMFQTYQKVDKVTKPTLILQKINLQDVLASASGTPIKVQTTAAIRKDKQLKSLESKLLLHDGVQHWTQYMGKAGNSVY